MLDRRTFLTRAALTGIGALAGGWSGHARANASPTVSDAVRGGGEAALRWAPYTDAMVVDGCGFIGAIDLPDEAAFTDTLIDEVRSSGLRVLHTTVGPVAQYEDAYEAAIRAIAKWESEIARHPDVFLAIRSSSDMERAHREKKMGVVYQFQDSAAIGEKLERVEDFQRLGLRTVQLTYNVRNLVGDGCMEAGNAGLSKFGHDLVAKLNERRLLVDLSHSGRRTAMEAITASKSPVLISHTGCAALVDLPRNKTDAELRAMAQRGGVVGLYLMPFLRESGQPMAADLIRHIEHAVKICGEDHVGIGTDNVLSPVVLNAAYKKQHSEFIQERRKRGVSAPGESEDVYLFLPDLNTTRRFEMIGALLSKRGHSDQRIGKILGGNFARVMGEVWG